MDAYAVGCGWRDALTVTIDPDWTSGLYLIVLRALGSNEAVVESEGFFIVQRPPSGVRTAHLFAGATHQGGTT